MKIQYEREKIGEGIHFTTIINKCQKANTVAVYFVTELKEETASLNAIVPYIISNSSNEYKTVTELSRKMAGLYGAFLRGSVTKLADSQVVSVVSGCINDRYTFDGEKITAEMTRVMIGCIKDPYIENGGFFAKDFELKKQEMLDDIDAEINEKRSYALKRASRIVYENEPAAMSAKGEKSSAEKLDPVSAYEQYKKLLKTAQIEITFVGDSDPGEIKTMLADAFNNMEREYAGDNSSEFSPLKTEIIRSVEQYDVAQSKMVMAFKSDCKDDAAMKLMNSVFGGTPFSKLFMNVREKLSLCYYCSSGYNNLKGVLIVDSGVEHANIEKAEAEILNQLRAVQNGDFKDEDVDNSRLSIINGLRAVNDGSRSITEWYFKQNYCGKSNSPEDEIDRINAVTREDIINAAKSVKLDTVYVLTGKESAEQ